MLLNYFDNRVKKVVAIISCVFIILGIIGLLGFINVNKDREFLKHEVTSLQNKSTELDRQVKTLEEENKTLKLNIEAAVKEQQEMKNTISQYDEKLKAAETEKLRFLNLENRPNKDSDQEAKPKTAYLTFDDGPSVNTGRILEILKSYNIKATFFVNGNENAKDKYKMILDEGHVIGNHTYTHDYKSVYSSVDSFMNDFDRLNSLIESINGYKVEIFRFPGGSTNSQAKKYGGSDIMKKIIDAMTERGYRYFDWNVSSADSDPGPMSKNKDVLTNNVLTQAKGKRTAIILMHDRADRDATVEALPGIIEGLQQQGFEFGVLNKFTEY